jgi:8-oxo-dGTP pyrophosphatase MutT (NUDIX family)
MKYRRGVFVVVYRKEEDKLKYLILKRILHWRGWEFPKGGMDKKENIMDMIKREIKEETGQLPLSIKRYNLSGKYRYPHKYPDRPGVIGQTYTLYSAEIKKEKVEIDKSEHAGYKWASFNQAIKLLTHPSQRKCLRIVNQRLSGK